jgi:DNA adenine methylase
MKLTRPILSYYGGKWRIAPKIIEYFPPHVCYVEPFGGGASILLRKKPSPVEVYNDLYGEVVNFFRCLRERTTELVWVLTLTPTAIEEHRAAKIIDLEKLDDLERARNFWIRSWQDRFQGGLPGWSGWKRTRAGTRPTPGAEVMYAAAQRLRNVYMESNDALEIILYYDTPETLFYVDPPYIHTGDAYTLSMDESAHRRLLGLLLNADGWVILSCIDNELYHDILGSNGWKYVHLRTKTMKNTHNIEAIWMNFE